MKRIIAAGLALTLLIPFVGVQAVSAAEKPNVFPSTQRGSHDNLEFFGVKVKRISASATATHLVDGPGLLYAICAFGGTTGKYSIAYDTTADPGGVGDPVDVLDDIYTLAISPKVYVNNDTASLLAGGSGSGLCWEPARPVKFVTGLYGKADHAGHQTFYYVGCARGANPCALTAS